MAEVLLGRPSKEIDWDKFDGQILSGEQLEKAAQNMRVSIRHLRAECRRIHKMSLKQYRKSLLERVGKPVRPFSPHEIKKLLIAYYDGTLARADYHMRSRKVKGIQYKPPASPSTGPSLFELVTYPQMHAVMTAMSYLSLQIGGITVRDGYEYPLKVWAEPTWQSDELPQLLEHYERDHADEWIPTKIGEEVIAKALIRFEKEFYKQILQGADHG